MISWFKVDKLVYKLKPVKSMWHSFKCNRLLKKTCRAGHYEMWALHLKKEADEHKPAGAEFKQTNW